MSRSRTVGAVVRTRPARRVVAALCTAAVLGTSACTASEVRPAAPVATRT